MYSLLSQFSWLCLRMFCLLCYALPYIQTIDIQRGFFESYLLAQWSRGSIGIDNDTYTTIRLSNLLWVPMWYTACFPTTLSKSHYTRLLFGTHGTYMLLATVSCPLMTNAHNPYLAAKCAMRTPAGRATTWCLYVWILQCVYKTDAAIYAFVWDCRN